MKAWLIKGVLVASGFLSLLDNFVHLSVNCVKEGRSGIDFLPIDFSKEFAGIE